MLLGLDGIDFHSALLEQCLALGHLDATRQPSLVTAILSSQVRRGEQGCSERPSFVGDRLSRGNSPIGSAGLVARLPSQHRSDGPFLRVNEAPSRH